MNKFIIAAGMVLTATLPGNAADAPPLEQETIDIARTLRDQALNSNSAYDILSDLTTEIGPRLAGTEAEQRAVKWAVARMKSLGFDKVWTESFPLDVWQRGNESLHITGSAAQEMTITALGKSVSTPKGGAQADIVHFATFADLEAAPQSSVKDKIVFISNKIKRTKDGSGYGDAVVARFSGARVAGNKGAKAVLIRSIGTDSHRLPHTGSLSYGDSNHKIPAAALSNPDADQMLRLLKKGPVNVHLILENHTSKGESLNVIGEISGRETPDEVVVLGSHIDSWDLGTGAIDDGAGVAMNIATAHFIKENAVKRPRRTLRVVLFGAEELGLIGARAYAERHKNDIGKFAIGAESDFGAGPIWALASNVGKNALPVVDKMAQLMGPLGIVRHEKSAGGGPDVGQLRAVGMPVLDLMQNGNDYFDLHHTGDDTLDKVSPENMRQNMAAWAVFAYVAADWPGSFKETE